MNIKIHSLKIITPLAGSICGILAGLALALTPDALAKEPARRAAEDQIVSKTTTKMAARTPDEAVKSGLEYLLKQQQKDGGWGQGGGWRQGGGKSGARVEGANVEDPSDLGNTCVSLVTLLRAGESPAEGAQREAARKAFEFICQQVEQADEKSLYVTTLRDTQLQVKIGTYVDTFLAGWALSELKGRVGDESAEKRRASALDKVVAKIERNQKDDGSFAENKGWAAVLSQGLCSKALNSAARSGAKVSNEALDKDQRQNLAGLDVAKGDFSATTAPSEPSSAGISLYREAAKLGGLRAKTQSNVARKEKAEKKIADPAAPAAEKASAQEELRKFADDEKASAVAQQAVAGKLGDSRYVAGFGNNGGEEFLSYLNLGESMRERGGKDWDAWKEKMQATLCSAQNEDGSWAGHHCITGRNFCTGTALLTLLIDRTPVGAVIGTTAPEKSARPTPKTAAVE
jgi:Prenyltransferase and squalene oxidase repeat